MDRRRNGVIKLRWSLGIITIELIDAGISCYSISLSIILWVWRWNLPLFRFHSKRINISNYFRNNGLVKNFELIVLSNDFDILYHTFWHKESTIFGDVILAVDWERFHKLKNILFLLMEMKK